MAVFQSRDTRTFEAGGDLSADQFKFVALNANGQVTLCGDGAQAIGILLNEPSAAGQAATVVVTGKVTVKAGATVTAGDEVASDANGECAPATTGEIVMGYALEDAVAGQVFAIELIQGGNVA